MQKCCNIFMTYTRCYFICYLHSFSERHKNIHMWILKTWNASAFSFSGHKHWRNTHKIRFHNAASFFNVFCLAIQSVCYATMEKIELKKCWSQAIFIVFIIFFCFECWPLTRQQINVLMTTINMNFGAKYRELF